MPTVRPEELVVSGYVVMDMSKYLSIKEVKSALPGCILEVEKGEPLLITSEGRPVAALVRPQDLERLERLQETSAEAGLASLAGGWDGSDELVHHLQASSRIGRREVADLDR